MQQIDLDEAKIQLSQLVDRAAAGEEIVIAKAGRAMARLVPLKVRSAPRTPGALRGRVTIGPDFDAPEIARAFHGEGS